MPTYNIGPCDCCGATYECDCCAGTAFPSTLHVTFTGGACDCPASGSTFALDYFPSGLPGIQFWGYAADTCGAWNGGTATGAYRYGFTILLSCDATGWSLAVSWWDDSCFTGFPSPCGQSAGQSVTIGGGNTCSPLSLTFAGLTYGQSIPPNQDPCAGSLPTAVVTL